jgi:hypothetical protein
MIGTSLRLRAHRIDSYIDHLIGRTNEVVPLIDIVPQRGTDITEVVQFHKELIKGMLQNGFEFRGVKIVHPACDMLRILRHSSACCTPIFKSLAKTLSKSYRIQYVEPGIFFDAGSRTRFGAAIEFTGSRFPFYPPHVQGYIADMGGFVDICTGPTHTWNDNVPNHKFVLTLNDEPVQVGSAKILECSPSDIFETATNYAQKIGETLSPGHIVFLSGCTSRVPVKVGTYALNYGIYGSVSATFSD